MVVAGGVIPLDSCTVDLAVRPFDLTIGPGMVWFCWPVLDPICLADYVKAHRSGVDGVPVARLFCELEAVVGENGMDLLRKEGEARTFPFPRRTYPTGSVTGMPSAV